jgi:hypothetical protein
MTISVAFFLSPEGRVLHVPDTHIGTIIRDPEQFGLTMEEIEAAYLRHGERVGTEGEARQEILLKVIEKGWLRLRRYPNRGWSVTADTLPPRPRYTSELGYSDS